MIIVPTRQGQLGNRLFHLSKIYSFCLKHQIDLCYPSLYDYSEELEIKSDEDTKLLFGGYYTFKAVNILFRILLKMKFLNSPFHKILKLQNVNQIHDLESKDTIQIIKTKKFVFLDGWGFVAGNLHIKCKDLIKYAIRPKESNIKKADIIINNLRAGFKKIIGVHIRRGDYKDFEEGRYYYSDDEYKMFIKSLVTNFNQKETCILIASNENLRKEYFNDLPINVYYSQENGFVDLILFSKCDFIIGPPSTFTMWASYINDVPLLMIKSRDQEIDMHDFLTYGDRR